MKTVNESTITACINKLIEETSIHAASALIRNRYSRALEDQRAVEVLRELKSRLINAVEGTAENDDDPDTPELASDNGRRHPSRIDLSSYIAACNVNRGYFQSAFSCTSAGRCAKRVILPLPYVTASGDILW